MTGRNYSSTAKVRSLVTGVDAAATTITVTPAANSADVWPAAPLIAAMDRGTANEELVLVTAVAVAANGVDRTFTVTRGFDTTPAVAHGPGAKVEHVTAAADFRDLVRDSVRVITGLQPADLPAAYPEGKSRFYNGTPFGGLQYPIVETTRYGQDAVQEVTSLITGDTLMRFANSQSPNWQPWAVAGGGYRARETEAIALATPGMPMPGLIHAHGPAVVHPGTTPIYTVPAGRHAVVKKIKLGRWGDLAAQGPGIGYIGVGGPGGFGHIGHVHLRKSESIEWHTAVVMGPGENLYYADNEATSVNFHAEIVEYDQALLPVHKFWGGGLGAAAFRQLYTIPDSHVITQLMVRNYTQNENVITIGQGGYGAIESYVQPSDTTILIEPMLNIPGGQGLYVANSTDCYVHAYGYKKLV